MSTTIKGVIITQKKIICDDRGRIMHIMKSQDANYTQFGEVYISTVYPGIVKGWHLHDKMILNYVVVKGMIKFAMYDARKESATFGKIQEVCLGEHNYVQVTVPPGVWNGFMGLGTEEAIVINFTDIPHDPNEIHRCDPHENDIPYSWKIKDR
ncbi:MAG: dTDP-4-dehydrorhamnose 3,5-epimerase family protein [Chitinophagales bacterium]|jgi:dTDP-4-dehydrorhamnose 3,5-epimerase|nr:dTDP-4-dehydrorhamnose 3,5-epimerase family protein [Chitinophagales bacterium]